MNKTFRETRAPAYQDAYRIEDPITGLGDDLVWLARGVGVVVAAGLLLWWWLQ